MELPELLSDQLGLKLKGFEGSAASTISDHGRFMSSSSAVLGKGVCQDLTSVST